MALPAFTMTACHQILVGRRHRIVLGTVARNSVAFVERVGGLRARVIDRLPHAAAGGVGRQRGESAASASGASASAPNTASYSAL